MYFFRLDKKTLHLQIVNGIPYSVSVKIPLSVVS